MYYNACEVLASDQEADRELIEALDSILAREGQGESIDPVTVATAISSSRRKVREIFGRLANLGVLKEISLIQCDRDTCATRATLLSYNEELEDEDGYSCTGCGRDLVQNEPLRTTAFEIIKEPERPAPRESPSGPDFAERTIDLAVIIALKEEFREIFLDIVDTAQAEYVEKLKHYFYYFEYPAGPKNPYRCVAAFIGGMGPMRAALLANKMIDATSPAAIVNVGIAGGIGSDVRLGDIVVADQAEAYMEDAKAVENEREGFSFALSGDTYKSDVTILRHTQNLEFAHRDIYANWQEKAGGRLKGLMPEADFEKLTATGHIRGKPKIEEGHIASGPVVAGATSFVEFIKKKDRKYLAVEMESAGVACAAASEGIATAFIRGVSDFGDDRKKDLDGVAEGSIRKYAMQNALELLWALLSLNHFPRKPEE